MDKINKFLRTLTAPQRSHLLKVLLPRIQVLKLEGLDVKSLKGYKDLYRLRWKDIRILFIKNKGKGVLCGMGRRKDVYKKL